MSMIPGCCCGRDLCDDYGLLIVEPKWYANYPVYPTPSLDFWISSSTGYTGATVGISGGWTGTVAGLSCDSLGISFGQYMPAEWQNWQTKFLGTHTKGTYNYAGNLEERDTGNFHYELRSTLILPSKYSQYQIENKIVNVGSLFNNNDIPFTDLAKAYEHTWTEGGYNINHHAWTQITTTGATVYALPNKPFCEWCSTEGATYIERNILPGKTGDYASHGFTINNVVFTDNLPVSTSSEKPRSYDIFYTVKQDVPIDSSLMRWDWKQCFGSYCDGATLDVNRCLEWAVSSTTGQRCCAVYGDTRSDDLKSTALISAARFQNNYRFFVFRVKLQKENIPDTDQSKIILQNTYTNGVFDFDYVVPKRTEECAAKCTEYNNQPRDPNNPYAPLDVVFSYAYYEDPIGVPRYIYPSKDYCYTGFEALLNTYGGGIIADCRPANYELDFRQYWNLCYFTRQPCLTDLNTSKRHPVFGEICKEAASTTIRTPYDCCAGYGGDPYFCEDCQLIEIISRNTMDYDETTTARLINDDTVVGTCSTSFSRVQESVAASYYSCCDRMSPFYDECVQKRDKLGEDILAIYNSGAYNFEIPFEGGGDGCGRCFPYCLTSSGRTEVYRGSARKQVTSCSGGNVCVRPAYTLEFYDLYTRNSSGQFPDCDGDGRADCTSTTKPPPRIIPEYILRPNCVYPPECPYDSTETKQPPKVLKVDATESTQYEYNPTLMYTGDVNYTDNNTPDYQKYLKYQMEFLKQEFPIIPNPDPYYPGSQYNRNYTLVTENPQCKYDKINYYKYSSLTNLRFLDLNIGYNTIGFGRCNIIEFKPTCEHAIQTRQDLESMGLYYKKIKNYQPWNNLKSFYGYSIASTAAGITYERLSNLVLDKTDNIYSYDFLKNNLNINLP